MAVIIPKRMTWKYIESLDEEEIVRYKKDEMQQLLEGLRKKYEVRDRQLSKVADKVWSPAHEKMEVFYGPDGPKELSSMTRNQMLHEADALLGFFRAQTSTVPGARKTMADQDARIFGTDARGRPKQRLTLQERTKMWSLYEEYLNTYKNAEALYGSNRIQQFLGQMVKDDKTMSTAPLYLAKLERALSEARDNAEYTPGKTVYSGSWTNWTEGILNDLI